MDIIFPGSNNKYMVKISQVVIEKMWSYRQAPLFAKEAGGALFGREEIKTGNIIIEFLTEPYPDDKRSRTGLIRQDKRHGTEYLKIYESFSRVHAYIGEWHTHPEARPMYSSKDLLGWAKTAKECPIAGKCFYHVIVGTKDLCVWEYRKDSRMLHQVCREKLEGI